VIFARHKKQPKLQDFLGLRWKKLGNSSHRARQHWLLRLAAHGRPRRVGETKEEREGVPFDGLPAAEAHRGGRISTGKRRQRFCSGV
jgi:hypothetical protein